MNRRSFLTATGFAAGAVLLRLPGAAAGTSSSSSSRLKFAAGRAVESR